MIKVRIPERHGDTLTVTPGGPEEPREYRVVNGIAEVAEEHLREFLALFEGAEQVDAGQTSSSTSAGTSSSTPPPASPTPSAETPPAKEA